MMKIETARIWTARLLLGFVMFTIGFAAGRRTAPMPVGASNEITAAVVGDESRVIVYAAHMTFRCPECTQIEWFARELVESEFAVELADGRLEFRTVDYMRDAAFARQYNISSSTVVVTRMENGEVQNFQRLDEVWTRINDRDAFFAYVRAAIHSTLNKEDDA